MSMKADKPLPVLGDTTKAGHPCQSAKSPNCEGHTEQYRTGGCFGYKAQYESAYSRNHRERFPHLHHHGPDLSVAMCAPCFYWEFWDEKVRNLGKRSVIVDGSHFMLGDPREESWPNSMKGHGGAKYRIRFFDGREVTTTSLWYQGNIPEAFRDKLPDNAEFVRE